MRGGDQVVAGLTRPQLFLIPSSLLLAAYFARPVADRPAPIADPDAGDRAVKEVAPASSSSASACSSSRLLVARSLAGIVYVGPRATCPRPSASGWRGTPSWIALVVVLAGELVLVGWRLRWRACRASGAWTSRHAGILGIVLVLGIPPVVVGGVAALIAAGRPEPGPSRCFWIAFVITVALEIILIGLCIAAFSNAYGAP